MRPATAQLQIPTISMDILFRLLAQEKVKLSKCKTVSIPFINIFLRLFVHWTLIDNVLLVVDSYS